jgi:hypothetical protein
MAMFCGLPCNNADEFRFLGHHQAPGRPGSENGEAEIRKKESAYTNASLYSKG